jgi:hypothetical protein
MALIYCPSTEIFVSWGYRESNDLIEDETSLKKTARPGNKSSITRICNDVTALNRRVVPRGARMFSGFNIVNWLVHSRVGSRSSTVRRLFSAGTFLQAAPRSASLHRLSWPVNWMRSSDAVSSCFPKTEVSGMMPSRRSMQPLWMLITCWQEGGTSNRESRE